MKILDIQTNIALKKAKSHLIYAYISIIVCGLLSFFNPFHFVFNLLLLTCLIYSIYAMYWFSKLTNISLIKYYIFILTIHSLYSFFLFLEVYHSLFIPFKITAFCMFLFIISDIYITFKISHKMSMLTDLPHFITAFRFYVPCILGITVISSLIVYGSDINVVFGMVPSNFIDILIDKWLIEFAFLIIALVVAFYISIVFVFNGLLKITYVKVCSID